MDIINFWSLVLTNNQILFSSIISPRGKCHRYIHRFHFYRWQKETRQLWKLNATYVKDRLYGVGGVCRNQNQANEELRVLIGASNNRKRQNLSFLWPCIITFNWKKCADIKYTRVSSNVSTTSKDTQSQNHLYFNCLQCLYHKYPCLPPKLLLSQHRVIRAAWLFEA